MILGIRNKSFHPESFIGLVSISLNATLTHSWKSSLEIARNCRTDLGGTDSRIWLMVKENIKSQAQASWCLVSS